MKRRQRRQGLRNSRRKARALKGDFCTSQDNRRDGCRETARYSPAREM